MEILQTKISLFKPTLFEGEHIMGKRPEMITLGDALLKEHQPKLLKAIQSEPDKSKRSALKQRLWAVTPSALCEGGRTKEHVKQHTTLMAFDIDGIARGQEGKYFQAISGLPYTLYLGSSASGTGLWGLFRISDPAKHSQHFDAMAELFRGMGITIDPAPRAENSLRFLAYDWNHYLNLNAEIFTEQLEARRSIETPCMVSNTKKDIEANSGHLKPTQWFNKNCTAEMMNDILEEAGFEFHSMDKPGGQKYRYTRPGKDVSAGLSVCFHEGLKTLYAFSSEVPDLDQWKRYENGWACSPTTALLLYAFEGEWKPALEYISALRVGTEFEDYV